MGRKTPSTPEDEISALGALILICSASSCAAYTPLGACIKTFFQLDCPGAVVSRSLSLSELSTDAAVKAVADKVWKRADGIKYAPMVKLPASPEELAQAVAGSVSAVASAAAGAVSALVAGLASLPLLFTTVWELYSAIPTSPEWKAYIGPTVHFFACKKLGKEKEFKKDPFGCLLRGVDFSDEADARAAFLLHLTEGALTAGRA